MANEFQLYTNPPDYSGHTIIAKTFLNGSQIGGNVAMSEVLVTGVFLGDMPGHGAGIYAVTFFDTADNSMVGQGIIEWTGTVEIDPIEKATFIQDIEGGRWKVDTATKQMTFYKADNATVVATFDLFDAEGTPTSINVFERQRV